jgi:hypothetical protein
MVSHGGPFATPRTRRASQVIESFSCHPTVTGWRMVLGAGSGGDTTSSLRSSRGRTRTAFAVAFSNFRFQHFPGGFTERTLALRSPDAAASLVAHRLTSRQVSALFRPHRWPDSSFCARSIRCRIRYTDCADCSRSFRRPQTAETGKDSGAPEESRGRATSSGQNQH